MVLPVATSNGPGVRFHVLGIPVRFDVWFFIIGTVFTLQYGVPVVVLWLTVLGGSVLVHELGHALVARTTGAEPQIVIHGLGGLTSWQPAGAVSRSRRIAISLAGPAAGIALGLVFVAVRRAGVGTSGDSLLLQRAMFYGIRINILYGLINLLPILPLDGGQTLRDLLPGDEASRQRTAAIVSVVVGIGAAIVAVAVGETFAAVFAAVFVAGNVSSLRAPRGPRARVGAPTGALTEAIRLHQAGNYDAASSAAQRIAAEADVRGDHGTAIAAIQLAGLAELEAGRASEAKRLLLELPAGSVDPMLEGRVLIATGQPALGADRLVAGHAAERNERTAYHLAVGLVQAGSVDRLLAVARDVTTPVSVVLSAARGAHDAAAFALAGQLAEIAGARAAGTDFATAAFVAARGWARAGENSRALVALRAAVTADRSYAAAAAADPSFAYLRGAEYDAAVRIS